MKGKLITIAKLAKQVTTLAFTSIMVTNMGYFDNIPAKYLF